MKKVLALLVVAACALPVFAGAQQVDNAKMLQMFSAQARPDWGNLQVILLNDRTVEALFGSSPAKAAFRTKARMTSVFFIQGTANKEFELKPEVTVTQKGETLHGQGHADEEFRRRQGRQGRPDSGSRRAAEEAGSVRAVQGDGRRPGVDFNLNDDDVRDYGNR